MAVLTFMSYNSTGLDEIKIRWINDYIDTFKVDFVQLQEHFKTMKTINSYFKKAFSGHDSFSVPGYRASNQENGRPKGGLSQLSSKRLLLRKEPCSSKHWRTQAQILHINGYKLMWINCYFPTDPQTIQFDDEELIKVLDDIESILDNNVYDDCLLGGDFNFDPRRNTGFASTVRDFLQKVGLKSVWDDHFIDFTHIHTDLKSTAILDHFFVNEGLLKRILEANVTHLGDNLSRHSPILLKLTVPNIPPKNNNLPLHNVKRPAWYKADSEEKSHYHDTLEQRLNLLPQPSSIICSNIDCKSDEHSLSRDRYVLNVLNTIIEVSHECIPLSSTKKISQQQIPEWNLVIKPLKRDSIFWHAVWVSAGRPSSGGLYLVMCHVRSKYHRAVKVVKREIAAKKKNRLAVAADLGNAEFLNELQTSFNKKKTAQKVPDCLEGRVDHEGILEQFKERYQALYNSADTSNEMSYLKERLTDLISKDCIKEVAKITPAAVKMGCRRMKAGKIDVWALTLATCF